MRERIGGAPQPPAGPEQGVDCVAEGDEGATLRIQVTRVEREVWKQLDKTPSVHRSDKNVDGAVEAVRVAIDAKRRFAGREEIVLALDATDSLRYALEGVVNEFRLRHGAWASAVGYAEIWIVGPGTTLVHRLDGEPV